MKRVIFSLCALMLVATADAQVRNGNMITERTKIGIHGGLSSAYQNVSTLDGSMSFDSRYGAIGGVSLQVPLKNGFYFQPEVNYVNMGSRYWSSEKVDGAQRDIYLLDNFNYLQLPLMVKYSALYSGLGIFGGPQVGILTNANSKPNGYGSEYVLDVKKFYKSYDISALLGIEYYFPNANDRAPQFGLSARAQFGFTDINAEGTNEAAYGTRRNNAFYLTAGIRF